MRNRGVEMALIEKPTLYDRLDLTSAVLSTSTDLQHLVRLVQIDDCRDAKRNLKIFSLLSQKIGQDAAIAKLTLDSLDTSADYWLNQSIWPKSFFRSSGFALEVQKLHLSAWLSEHSDILQSVPAIFSFIVWAAPYDWKKRLSLLKGILLELGFRRENILDLAPELYQKTAELLDPINLPSYHLDLSFSEEFSSNLAKAVFKSSVTSDIVSQVSPLKRPVLKFTEEQLAWKIRWESYSVHFGYRNETAYQLSMRIGRLANHIDISSLLACFNRFNRQDETCISELESSVKVAFELCLAD
jgi:hypothetical protein